LSAATAFKDPLRAVEDIAHALAQIPDPLQRSQRGFELLGESGREIAAIAVDFDKLRERSSKGLFDEATQRKLEETRQQMQDIHEAWQDLIAAAAKPVVLTLQFITGVAKGSGMGLEFMKMGLRALPQDAASGARPFVGPIQTPQDRRAAQQETDTESAQQGDASAFLKNYRTEQYDVIDRQLGNARNPFEGKLQAVDAQLHGLREKNLAPTEYQRQRTGLLGQQASLEKQQKLFEEARNQTEELGWIQMPKDPAEANRLFLDLPKRFDRITGTAQYQGAYNNLRASSILNFSQAGSRMFKNEPLEQMLEKMHMPLTSEDRLFSGDIERQTRIATEGGKANEQLLTADLAHQQAIQTGATGMLRARGGMTPQALAQADFAQQRALI